MRSFTHTRRYYARRGAFLLLSIGLTHCQKVPAPGEKDDYNTPSEQAVAVASPAEGEQNGFNLAETAPPIGSIVTPVLSVATLTSTQTSTTTVTGTGTGVNRVSQVIVSGLQTPVTFTQTGTLRAALPKTLSVGAPAVIYSSIQPDASGMYSPPIFSPLSAQPLTASNLYWQTTALPQNATAFSAIFTQEQTKALAQKGLPRLYWWLENHDPTGAYLVTNLTRWKKGYLSTTSSNGVEFATTPAKAISLKLYKLPRLPLPPKFTGSIMFYGILAMASNDYQQGCYIQMTPLFTTQATQPRSDTGFMINCPSTPPPGFPISVGQIPAASRIPMASYPSSNFDQFRKVAQSTTPVTPTPNWRFFQVTNPTKQTIDFSLYTSASQSGDSVPILPGATFYNYPYEDKGSAATIYLNNATTTKKIKVNFGIRMTLLTDTNAPPPPPPTIVINSTTDITGTAVAP